jgi:hypothetical protein
MSYSYYDALANLQFHRMGFKFTSQVKIIYTAFEVQDCYEVTQQIKDGPTEWAAKMVHNLFTDSFIYSWAKKKNCRKRQNTVPVLHDEFQQMTGIASKLTAISLQDNVKSVKQQHEPISGATHFMLLVEASK